MGIVPGGALVVARFMVSSLRRVGRAPLRCHQVLLYRTSLAFASDTNTAHTLWRPGEAATREFEALQALRPTRSPNQVRKVPCEPSRIRVIFHHVPRSSLCSCQKGAGVVDGDGIDG